MNQVHSSKDRYLCVLSFDTKGEKTGIIIPKLHAAKVGEGGRGGPQNLLLESLQFWVSVSKLTTMHAHIISSYLALRNKELELWRFRYLKVFRSPTLLGYM